MDCRSVVRYSRDAVLVVVHEGVLVLGFQVGLLSSLSVQYSPLSSSGNDLLCKSLGYSAHGSVGMHRLALAAVQLMQITLSDQAIS